jgi:hypothetical protein
MLLTKPLQNFLNANRTPYVHTLLLVTPTGKLLSSSSPIPASTLRAQATHACSIWSLYKPLIAAGTITSALPSPFHDEEEDEDDHTMARRAADPGISSITIQLEKGVMIIRALKCSLLFVVVGPLPASASASSSSPHGLRQGLSFLSVASAASPPTSSHSGIEGRGRRHDASFTSLNGLRSSAASEGGGGSLKILKRQAEELGKWLDGELEGFTLPSGL